MPNRKKSSNNKKKPSSKLLQVIPVNKLKSQSKRLIGTAEDDRSLRIRESHPEDHSKTFIDKLLSRESNFGGFGIRPWNAFITWWRDDDASEVKTIEGSWKSLPASVKILVYTWYALPNSRQIWRHRFQHSKRTSPHRHQSRQVWSDYIFLCLRIEELGNSISLVFQPRASENNSSALSSQIVWWTIWFWMKIIRTGYTLWERCLICYEDEWLLPLHETAILIPNARACRSCCRTTPIPCVSLCNMPK